MFFVSKLWSSLGENSSDAAGSQPHARHALNASCRRSLQQTGLDTVVLSFVFVAGNKRLLCFWCTSKWTEMGPSVVDTVVDLRNIQRSLWEVSPAGSACSIAHGGLVTFY